MNQGIKGKTFVVSGGLGFVGSALCLELVRRGAHQVRAFDLRTSSLCSQNLLKHGVHCIQGDIVRKEDVEKALRGVDCVFHLASFGISGKEMLQFGRMDSVNIDGTCHVLDTCLQFGIQRLVYLSTYNVVFGGKVIVNGNETLPYFPIDDNVDPYGQSKSIAEQLVLKSNGRPLKKKNEKCLYTCAIRPATVYGPGEERHLPRIVSLAKLGLLLFKIGDPNVISDWIYVDNLVLALILASMKLLDDAPGKDRHPIAAGQSYFVSDGSPVNSFKFFRPLLTSLDCDLPKVSFSVPRALLLAKVFWATYSLLYPCLNKGWLPQPLILPAEVYKIGVTHYFSPLKAKEELGYVPVVSPREGMAATIAYWQENTAKALDGPTIYARLFCVIGLSSLFSVAYLPDVGPVPFLRAIGLFFLRSQWMLRVAFVIVATAHVSQGVYACFLAKRVDPANAKGWFWQTFALGMFSLRFLLKRARKKGFCLK